MSTKSSSNPNPNLDLLRAVAILCVILDHNLMAVHKDFWHGINITWIGIIGVWMFFVHTSLVLMWSLERRPYTLDFYIRRVFRIYPLTLIAIAIILLTHARVTGFGKDLFDFTPVSHGNVLATSLLLYNLWPPAWEYKPVEYVIWTLPLEIEMYLFLPVLFAFARKGRPLLPLLLMWVFLAVLIYPYFVYGVNIFTAVLNFLPGVMAFVAFRHRSPTLPFWSFPVFLACGIAAVLRQPTIPAGWVFCLFLGLTLPLFKPMRSAGLRWLSHNFAKYSFGAYLAHPFALAFGFYYLRGHSFALRLGVEAVSIVVLSVAAYHSVEKPMIDLGSRFAAYVERLLVRRSLDADLRAV